MTEELPLLMTWNDAAEETGFEPATLKKFSRQGEFPSPIIVGKSQRIVTHEFLDWLADRAVNHRMVANG
jgi:predicted DNA-binding transcriptional regulator AlpA